MTTIHTMEPEFSADFIGNDNISEVIDELRLKINELINAHNAPLAAAAAAAAEAPAGGRRTRRRRKRRRKTRRRRKRRKRRTRRGGDLFGFRKWVKKKTGYTARKGAQQEKKRREEETEQALARLEGNANNRGVINNS